MSSPQPPHPERPLAVPQRGPLRPPPSVLGTAFRWFFGVILGMSLAIAFLFFLFFLVVGSIFFRAGSGEDTPLTEHHLAGKKGTPDKIAVIHVEGVILEGLLSYPRRQIDQAAADDRVKAVVLRIDSPGGSITASDDLHKRLRELRDGVPSKKTTAKPIIVSMASLAASGGYYIAMPSNHLVAERTTITGSIGVYASFPNVSELADSYGVKLDIIKRGNVKASGNMFQKMTPQEHQLWQDMVDHAYDQFLAVVREGRGTKLKYPLEAEIPEERKQIPVKVPEGPAAPAGKEEKVVYVRQLADGGIFTADRAQKYGLIDQIGYLDDAIAEARKRASLSEDCQVISYERPINLLSVLMGAQAQAPSTQLDLGRLAEGTRPRLWYLMPQGGLSGMFAAGMPPRGD